MKNILPSLFVTFMLCLCLSCEDDDGPFSLFSTNYCEEGLPTLGCFDPFTTETDWSAEDLNAWLVGDWKVVAEGFADSGSSAFCSTDLEGETSFSFSEDGVYRFELPDGQSGESTYSVETLCGTIPPCIYYISYETPDLVYLPYFRQVCPNGVAWHDERPVDGGMEVYEKSE